MVAPGIFAHLCYRPRRLVSRPTPYVGAPSDAYGAPRHAGSVYRHRLTELFSGLFDISTLGDWHLYRGTDHGRERIHTGGAGMAYRRTRTAHWSRGRHGRIFSDAGRGGDCGLVARGGTCTTIRGGRASSCDGCAGYFGAFVSSPPDTDRRRAFKEFKCRNR